MLLMCQGAQHITTVVQLYVNINIKRTNFLGVLIDEHINQVPHINNENCHNFGVIKPAFHGACFWSGFGADFVCEEHAPSKRSF